MTTLPEWHPPPPQLLGVGLAGLTLQMRNGVCREHPEGSRMCGRQGLPQWRCKERSGDRKGPRRNEAIPLPLPALPRPQFPICVCSEGSKRYLRLYPKEGSLSLRSCVRGLLGR